MAPCGDGRTCRYCTKPASVAINRLISASGALDRITDPITAIPTAPLLRICRAECAVIPPTARIGTEAADNVLVLDFFAGRLDSDLIVNKDL